MAPGSSRRPRNRQLERSQSSSTSPELRNRFEPFINFSYQGGSGGMTSKTARRTSESPSPTRVGVGFGVVPDDVGVAASASRQKLICDVGGKSAAHQDPTKVTFVTGTSGGGGGDDGAVLGTVRKSGRRRRFKKRTVEYDLAPEFLQHNRFILSGYRKSLSLGQCVKSCFWWTNESINIWSHILGVVWLFVILFMDLQSIFQLAPTYYDIVVAVMMVLSFQACLSLSVVFHVFNCCSERVCHTAFKWDVFGVAWATFTFYWTGIYCAYSCFAYWRYFYWITAFSAFCVTIGLHLWEEFLKEKYRPHRVIIFGVWAAFGFVPTFHWFFLYGGWSHPWVKTIVGRVLVLYFLLGMGFFFYLSRIPERFKPGFFDFIGSSHQWWHLFAVLSFWWWHNTGIECFRYLKVYGCPNLPGVEEDPWRPLAKLGADVGNVTLLTSPVGGNSTVAGFLNFL